MIPSSAPPNRPRGDRGGAPAGHAARRILQTLVGGLRRPARARPTRARACDDPPPDAPRLACCRGSRPSATATCGRMYSAIATAWRQRPRPPGESRRLRRDRGLRQPRLPDRRPGVRLPRPGVGAVAAQRARYRDCSRSSPRSSRGWSLSSAEYLDLAVESALDSTSLRHLVVFDYQPEVDDHRESTAARADARLRDAGMSVTVETLGEVVARGSSLPPRTRVHRRQRRPAGDDPVHVGQHRSPKGRDVHRADAVQAVDVAASPADADSRCST